MRRIHLNPCYLYGQENGGFSKTAKLQAGGSFVEGMETFLRNEHKETKMHVFKSRKEIGRETVKFKGLSIKKHEIWTATVN